MTSKKAADYLRQAAEVIEQRGTLRDTPEGERSMARAVEAYTALVGETMGSELQGWVFMCVLKLARATAGKPHIDDAVDLSGYAALMAECLAKEEEEEVRYRETVDQFFRQETGWTVFDPKTNERTEFPSYQAAFNAALDRTVSDGWTPWEGETRNPPVEDALVLVRLRNGYETSCPEHADAWYWKHENNDPSYDIVAYKVVEDESKTNNKEV